MESDRTLEGERSIKHSTVLVRTYILVRYSSRRHVAAARRPASLPIVRAAFALRPGLHRIGERREPAATIFLVTPCDRPRHGRVNLDLEVRARQAIRPVMLSRAPLTSWNQGDAVRPPTACVVRPNLRYNYTLMRRNTLTTCCSSHLSHWAAAALSLPQGLDLNGREPAGRMDIRNPHAPDTPGPCTGAGKAKDLVPGYPLKLV